MTSVLIVEDEESLAEPLAFLLKKEGFEVFLAGDGPTALEVFAAEKVDIVLLDLMLPGMSGTEVCRQLRQTSAVPVIMVTARDSEIDKVVGLELGADDYVTKPYLPASSLPASAPCCAGEGRTFPRVRTSLMTAWSCAKTA